MSVQSSTLLMRLIDGISGPGKAIESSLGRLRRGMGTLGNQAGSSSAAMGFLGRALAPAALAYAAKKAITAFAEEERSLDRIGIAAGASSAQMTAAHENVYNLGQALGMLPAELSKGLGALAVGGRTVEESLNILPAVGRAVNATGGDIIAFSKLGGALTRGLKIDPAELDKSFQIMQDGTKKGLVTLTEMAAGFPDILPAAERAGWKGQEGLRKMVAVVEAARQKLGSSEAAIAGLDEGVMKVETQRVAKRFEKMGVDITGTLKRARAEGKDTFQAIFGAVWKATKGDPQKLGQLFTSEEAQKFWQSMMTGGAQYANEIYRALQMPSNSIAEGNARIAEGAQASINRLSAAWTKFSQETGHLIVSAGGAHVLEQMADAAARLAVGLGISQKHIKELTADPKYSIWDHLQKGKDKAERAGQMIDDRATIVEQNKRLEKFLPGSAPYRRAKEIRDAAVERMILGIGELSRGKQLDVTGIDEAAMAAFPKIAEVRAEFAREARRRGARGSLTDLHPPLPRRRPTDLVGEVPVQPAAVEEPTPLPRPKPPEIEGYLVPPIEGADLAVAQMGNAGAMAGGAFRSNLASELAAAEQMILDFAARMGAALSFSSSPSINPAINGGAIPQSGSAPRSVPGWRTASANDGGFYDNSIGRG